MSSTNSNVNGSFQYVRLHDDTQEEICRDMTKAGFTILPSLQYHNCWDSKTTSKFAKTQDVTSNYIRTQSDFVALAPDGTSVLCDIKTNINPKYRNATVEAFTWLIHALQWLIGIQSIFVYKDCLDSTIGTKLLCPDKKSIYFPQPTKLVIHHNTPLDIGAWCLSTKDAFYPDVEVEYKEAKKGNADAYFLFPEAEVRRMPAFSDYLSSFKPLAA